MNVLCRFKCLYFVCFLLRRCYVGVVLCSRNRKRHLNIPFVIFLLLLDMHTHYYINIIIVNKLFLQKLTWLYLDLQNKYNEKRNSSIYTYNRYRVKKIDKKCRKKRKKWLNSNYFAAIRNFFFCCCFYLWFEYDLRQRSF